MKDLDHLKKAIAKSIAKDLRFRNRWTIFSYLTVSLVILAIAVLSTVEVFAHQLGPLDFIIPVILLALFLWLEKSLEKKILQKANEIAAEFFLIKISIMFSDYFGRDQFRRHKRNVVRIIYEIRELQLCTLEEKSNRPTLIFDEKIISLCPRIELEPLKYIFRQNGQVIIVIGFGITPAGEFKMSYYKNENPGEFQKWQFPFD